MKCWWAVCWLRSWRSVAAGVVLALAVPAKIAAVQPVGLSLSPPLIQSTLTPNQPSQTIPITLTNHTAATQNLKLVVVDFGALDENGGVFLIGQPNDFERQYGLAAWVSLDRPTLTLAPGQSQTVQATILNQINLSPGGHYGAVVFEAAGGGLTGAGINLKPEITALMFIIKNGDVRYGLDLADHQVAAGGWLQGVTLKLHNSGNVHLTPRGLISVTDPLGREVSRGVINLNSNIILPGMNRNYRVDMGSEAAALIPGTYHVKVQFRYDGQDNFVVVQYDFKYASRWDWVLVVVLSLAVVGVFLGFRRWRNRGWQRPKTHQQKS